MYRINDTYDIKATWSIGFFGIVYFFKGLRFVCSVPAGDIKDMKYGDDQDV